MQVTLQMLLIVCPLIFLASTIDAVGGGGGLISLPAYLLAGLPPAMAAGSNKMSASVGTLIATGRYLKSGRLLVKPALCAAAGALPGAWLGAELLKRADPNAVRVFLIVAIPIMALVLVLKKDAPERTRPITAARLVGCFALGLGCGFYDGFFGPGTGTLLIMGLTWLIGMDMVTASGSAKLVNLASNISALVSLLTGGQVLFALALPAAAFSLAGGYLGSWLAIRRGAVFIRKIMLAVLLILIARLAAEWFL
ncbi:MAG: TSUP family transporter [Clostridia bacterium]|nr:TSUP family transporter [Clostridia bacterium]